MGHFHGQNEIDRILVEKIFKGRTDGFFVECGAYNGITDSNCLALERDYKWKGLNLEPVPYLFDRLAENRPNSTNLNFALSDTDGTTEFTQALLRGGEHFGNGSIRHTEEHMKELQQRSCSFVKYTVATKKLSTLIKDHNIPDEWDLFSLDVEGHELTVLSYLPSCRVRPKVIVVEFGYVGRQNLLDLLGKENYSLVYEDSINLVFEKRN